MTLFNDVILMMVLKIFSGFQQSKPFKMNFVALKSTQKVTNLFWKKWFTLLLPGTLEIAIDFDSARIFFFLLIAFKKLSLIESA